MWSKRRAVVYSPSLRCAVTHVPIVSMDWVFDSVAELGTPHVDSFMIHAIIVDIALGHESLKFDLAEGSQYLWKWLKSHLAAEAELCYQAALAYWRGAPNV